MSHSYRITVQRLPEGGSETPAGSLTFEVSNHDEVLQLVEKVKARGILPSEETAAFIVGLKLFGEVMLQHRREPLFAELFPHFGTFMKRLKGANAQEGRQ